MGGEAVRIVAVWKNSVSLMPSAETLDLVFGEGDCLLKQIVPDFVGTVGSVEREALDRGIGAGAVGGRAISIHHAGSLGEVVGHLWSKEQILF